MKFKAVLEDVKEFRKALGILIQLRKQCVFRFHEDQFCIISAVIGEPQVWCKLSTSIFEQYHVDAIRNVISFEINIEPLYQVLKHFEKSDANTNLVMRLQRNPNKSTAASKALVSLSLLYQEQININSNINHSFNIPVRLLKMQSDERIKEPTISGIDLCMHMPNSVVPLFKRVERYKTSDSVIISGNQSGTLKLIIEEEQRKISIQWKGKLEVKRGDDEADMGDDNLTGNEESGKNVELKMRLKYWNIASKICESCEGMTFIISGDAGIVYSYLDMDNHCELIYYVNGFSNVDTDS